MLIELCCGCMGSMLLGFIGLPFPVAVLYCALFMLAAMWFAYLAVLTARLTTVS